jgi:glycosyltransferase involved in cell wall biosynthesis
LKEDTASGKDKGNNVVFMGKILMHNYEAMVNMAKAIEKINNNRDIKIVFDIYSTYGYFDPVTMLNKYPCCRFHSWVSHDEVMDILRNAGILYLPITANKETQKFTKFSMSTKVPEYMSSKTPIIYCGPKDIAMTDLLESTNTAYIINGSSVVEIKATLLEVLNNHEVVAETCQRAFNFVSAYMSAEKVNNKLQNIFD